MGHIASEVHSLVRGLCKGDINESEFVSELRGIDRRHQIPGNIGRAIQKGIRMADVDEAEKDRVWRLARSVNEDIVSDYDEWADASDWDIG